MKTTLMVIALLGLAASAYAACPNHCSGHGKCVADDLCSCFNRYTGADCSQRKCKENKAWADGSTDEAHEYTECSNKGTCDRATGECLCYPGYDGAACHRSECPNACSGHGTCEYLNELSGGYDKTLWDNYKIQGCKCDGGYEGFDCSLRMCPRGDDPLTACPNNLSGQCSGEVYTIVHTVVGTPSGEKYSFRIKDLYNEWHRSRAFDPSSASSIQGALEDMAWCVKLADTTPVTANYAAQAYTIVIKLQDPKRITDIMIDSNVCTEAGCLPMVSSSVTSVTSSVVTRTSDNSGASATYLLSRAETDVCSNRGICDQSTGICQCFEGHTGLACETQTILV